MIEIETLGTPGVRRDGEPVSLPTKQLAVLLYLALAPNRALRRDTLLAVFWPESDDGRARAALRQTLRGLRRQLGTDVFVTRGDDEISLQADLVACDLAAHEATLAADGDGNRVLASEPFLHGFHLTGCPAFEQWVDERREGVRRAERAALRRLAEQADEAGSDDAAEWWGRLVRADPLDARAMVSLIEALVRRGEPARAVAEYDAYRDRLHRDWDLSPDPIVERALANAQTERNLGAAPAPKAVPAAPVLPPAPPPAEVGSRSRRPRTRYAIAAMTTAVVALLFAVAKGILWRSPSDIPVVAIRSFENLTGDSLYDRVARSLARGIVDAGASLDIIRMLPPDADDNTNRTLEVTGTIQPRNDSVEFQVRIVDLAAGRVLPAPVPVRASRDEPWERLEIVEARALGGLAYYASDFSQTRCLERRPPSWEAYQAYRMGVQLYLHSSPAQRADSAFRRALQLDPTYTEAYLRLARIHIQDWPILDSLARAMRANIDHPTAADRLAIEKMEAVAQLDWRRAMLAARSLAECMPEERLDVGINAVYLRRSQEAVDAFRELGRAPWTKEFWLYWFFYQAALHQLGEYQEERRITAEAERWVPRYRGFLSQADRRARIALGDVESVTRELSAGTIWNSGIEPYEYLAHGAPDAAADHWERVLRTWAADSTNWRLRSQAAMAWQLLGRPEETIEHLTRWLTLDRGDRGPADIVMLHGALGTAYARAGNRRAADSVLANLVRDPPQEIDESAYLAGARIAAQLSNKEQAVRLLTQAFGAGIRTHPQLMPHQSYIYWHSDPDLLPLRGYAPFDELVAVR